MERLSRQEARAILLSNQSLAPRRATPEDVLTALVAVQTQYAASLEVALAARVDFSITSWESEALQPGGPVVKSWSIRHTLHAHLHGDFQLIRSAVGDRYRDHYHKRLVETHGIHNLHDLEAAASEALMRETLSRRELHERVPGLSQIPYAGWGVDIMGLAFAGKLCVVGRGASQRFASLMPEDYPDAMLNLIRRYLAGYGPATPNDFRYWAGVKVSEVKPAWDALRSEMIDVQIDNANETHFLIRRPDVTDARGVHLLAKFDPLAMGHADKSLWLASEHDNKVFRKAGQVEAVILIDGIASGTWRMTRRARETQIALEPFRRFTKREGAGIVREAKRLARSLTLPPPIILGLS